MKHLFVMLAVVAALVGCTGTKTLYSQAETPTQYVKVVLIHHNALGTEVADLRADPTVSQAAKDKLLVAYKATVCSPAELNQGTLVANCKAGPSQQLEAAGRAYEALHNAKTEAEMQNALARLVALLSTLINVVNGAK